MLEHLLLEVDIAALLDLRLGVFVLLLSLPARGLFFLFLFLQIAVSHEDHFLVYPQPLIFLSDHLLPRVLVVLLPVLHDLLHFGDIFGMFGSFGLSLFLLVSGT